MAFMQGHSEAMSGLDVNWKSSPQGGDLQAPQGLGGGVKEKSSGREMIQGSNAPITREGSLLKHK